MRKIIVIAVLLFVATTVAAQTKYEVQGPLYGVSITADSSRYSVRVIERASGQTVLDSAFPLALDKPMGTSSGLPDGEVRLQLRMQGVQLIAMVEVERGSEIVDAVGGSWATKARPKITKVSGSPNSQLGERYPSVKRLGDGNDIKAPVVINRAEPIYSEEARRARISGIVILETLIDENGDVKDVAVLKPLPFGLDAAAVDAVRQWKFKPATLNGVPVPVLFNLTVNFKIDNPLPPQ